MKKFFIIIAILLMSLAFFVACDTKQDTQTLIIKQDGQTLALKLSTSFGGTAFSDNYIDENGFERVFHNDTIEKVVDKFDYDEILSLLPSESQMKTEYFTADAYFLGWCFCLDTTYSYYGHEFTRENWNKYFATHQVNTLSLYAKWMFNNAIRLVFFLDKDDAYFKINISDEIEYTHARECIAFNNTGEYYWGLNPSETSIIMPKNWSMDGWQFEDGSDLNAENLAKQTPDEQRVVKAFPRWVEETRIYFLLDYHVDEQTRSMGIRISQEAYDRYHTYRGVKNENPYVLKDDFDTFVAMLPTKDDMEVWVGQAPVWNEETQSYEYRDSIKEDESFERFAWKILSHDEEGNTILVDLTKENWLKNISDLQYRSVRLVLDYALKDVNQTIFVNVQAEVGSGHPVNDDGSYFVLSLSDEALNNLDRFGDAYGLYVGRDSFEDLIQRLPSLDTLVLTKKFIGTDGEVVTDMIATAEWELCVLSYGWFEWRVAERYELTEQNWLDLTEKYVCITVSIKYTIKND